MNPAGSFKPAGVVLAGGQSSRFGVTSKALAPLSGKPLVRHVLERLAGQAGPILLSVQEKHPALETLGYEMVEDVVPRHRGPLTGLCSAMQWLADNDGGEWLLLCPCDAPFLPRDLAVRLYQGAVNTGQPVTVAKYQDVPQPTFSLWNTELMPAVRDSVMEQGRGGLMQVLNDVPHAFVEWAVRDVPPFFNVNTPDDLERAGRLLDGRPTET
jgi:molybdopterin-guanine dinucleotide biosynthesis protein A